MLLSNLFIFCRMFLKVFLDFVMINSEKSNNPNIKAARFEAIQPSKRTNEIITCKQFRMQLKKKKRAPILYCSVFNTFLERFLIASYTQKNIKPVIILPCKNCVFILFCKVSSNYRLVFFFVWLNLLKIPPPPAWTRRAASVSSRPDVCGVSCGTTRNFPRDGGARERGRRSAIGGWCYVGGPPKRPPRRDCPAGRGR